MIIGKFKKGEQVYLIDYPQATGVVTGCSKRYVFVHTKGTKNGNHPFGEFDQVELETNRPKKL